MTQELAAGRLDAATPLSAQLAAGDVTPVLVATAEESLGRMLAFALQQMRVPFRQFVSGTDLLPELETMAVGGARPIVLLDLDLPGFDGHAILERLEVSRPDTFLVIAISAHADESVQVRALMGGAMDHVAKPFNVRVLMAKVQRWLGLSASLAREV